MFRKSINVILVLAFLYGGPVFAASKTLAATKDLETVLPEVALNESVANRTFTLPTNVAIGFSHLILFVNYTWATNGTLTIICKAGPSLSDNDYRLTTCDESTPGECKLNLGGKFTLAVTATVKFWARLGIEGAKDIQCTSEHSAATANDKIKIKAYLYSK